MGMENKELLSFEEMEENAVNNAPEVKPEQEKEEEKSNE
jgi:hypothetical protein